jgi:uncharacterized protein (DUF433 family)
MEDHRMAFNLQTDAPPLIEDSSGGLRVGNTRVLLELIINAFQDGATPESIVQRYDTLSLPDVYSVIAYYLRHREEVEAYLAGRERRAEEVREYIERDGGDLREIRDRLATQRKR